MPILRPPAPVVLVLMLCWGASGVRAEYVGPFANATPVNRIMSNPVHDQVVVVRGQIIRRLGSELYLFRDGSGEIIVEIDPPLFPRSPLKAETPVEIRGQVETGWKDGPRIEADDLIVLPSPPKGDDAKPGPARDGEPRSSPGTGAAQ